MTRSGSDPSSRMPEQWRLILDSPADGVWNMAVDETLLASVQAGGVPTLRLYGWRGPWLSLGYAQPLPPGLVSACARAEVGIVRRVTGGAAVLHGADVTYSLTAPEAALPDGLRASYALVSRALLRALGELGVSAYPASGPAPTTRERPFDCFERPGQDEICVGGRKLAGSAQRRAGGAVLQHGSVRLGDDAIPAAQAAGIAPDAATNLAALGVQVPDRTLRSALVDAFAAELDVGFEPATLASEERRMALARYRERRAKPWAPPSQPGLLASRPPLASR